VSDIETLAEVLRLIVSDGDEEKLGDADKLPLTATEAERE
jgi:hypothetical protein